MEAQSINWIELAAFSVSIFMAIVAVTSTLISFVIFRKNSSPEVIIYPEINEPAKVIVNLVIKNIGNEVARNILFYPERDLPNKAFGIENPKMPEVMNEGPIKTGIPYLAPGATRIICWGQYAGLEKYIGAGSIKVIIKYERPSGFLMSKKLESMSFLDIKSFETTPVSDNSWEKKMAGELSTLNKHMEKISKSINEKANN